MRNQISTNRSSNGNYTIVINEVLANAINEDTGEFVELYNYGTEPVNVSGWFVCDLKDSNDKIVDYEGEYDWGSKGTTIPPLSFCLYVDPEYAGEYNQLLTNSTAPSNVIMVTCDSDTTVGNGLTNSKDSITIDNGCGYQITCSWNVNAGEGRSFGLIPDASSAWVVLDSTSPGFTNGLIPKIVINEFKYNPKGSDAKGEWVELFNADEKPIDLTGWKLSDADSKELILPELILNESCYAVIHTGVKPDNGHSYQTDPSHHIFFNRTTSIWTNTGDCINLSTSTGLCVDYVSYGNRSTVDKPVYYLNWIGPNPVCDEGNTLALFPNGKLTDSAVFWKEVWKDNITEGWNNEHIYNFEIQPQSIKEYVEIGRTGTLNFTITNKGTIGEYFGINLSTTLENWTFALNKNDIFINTLDTGSFKLNITAPLELNDNKEVMLNLTITPFSKPEKAKIIPLTITVPSAELNVKWMKIENEFGLVDTILEGELITIRGRIYNSGERASDEFNVSITIKEQNSNIGSTSEITTEKLKFYNDLKSKVSKYPGFIWDTLGCSGNYSIIMKADHYNRIEESNENDNIISTDVEVVSTLPSRFEKQILIQEVYYDTLLSGEPEEYIVLYNPTKNTVNLTHWKLEDGEGIISFPRFSFIKSREKIVIAQSGTFFNKVFGYYPDYEITDDSEHIPELNSLDYGFKLTNSGDEIILRNDNRHIIDVIVYENSDYKGPGWKGSAVPSVDEGNVLKRNKGELFNPKDSQFVDTNTSSDWIGYSEKRAGQSDFPVKAFKGKCNLSAFVTPGPGLTQIIKLIQKANNTIDISSYVLTNDLIKEELIDALLRKIRLRILLSGELGDVSTESGEGLKSISSFEWKIVSELFACGAKIKFMTSIPEEGIISRYERINSKYIIVDGKYCLITSENFGLSSFPVNKKTGNRGYGVIIENAELAVYLTGLFENDWNDSRTDLICFDPQRPVFHDIDNIVNAEGNLIGIKDENYSYEFNNSCKDEINSASVYEDCKLTPVIGPEHIFSSSSVVDLIKTAEKSILITLFKCSSNWSSNCGNHITANPYLNEVLSSALRGVTVKFLFCPHGFQPANYWNNNLKIENQNYDVLRFINEFSSYNGLSDKLEARFAYLLGLDYLHGNIIIVDDRIVQLSSFNWAFEELRTNRELGIQIENPTIAQYFQDYFNSDWSSAPKIYCHAEEEYWENHNNTTSILITEVYYDSQLSSEPDEYFALFNPTEKNVDLSGWFVSDREGTLWFPNGISIKPDEKLYITRYADVFKGTFGFYPDFELFENGDSSVKNLLVVGGLFRLGNDGDEIVLLDSKGSVVDVLIYGKSKYEGDGWGGKPVYDLPEGRILIRNSEELTKAFIDSNTKSDWESIREFFPGQSKLPLKKFMINQEVISEPVATTFVSPDSSYNTVYEELSRAERTIFINVYQLDHPRLVDLLIELSENGIHIKILLEGDPVGGLSKAGKTCAYRIQQAGCEIYIMANDPSRDIYDRYSFNHAKYAVIDSKTVMIMSENWKTTGIPSDNTFGNRGAGIIIRDSEVANYFTMLFVEDCNNSRKDILRYNVTGNKYGLAEEYLPQEPAENAGLPDDAPFYTNYYQPRFPSKDIFGDVVITPVISPEHSLLEHGSILELLRSASEQILIEQLQCYRFWGNTYNKQPNQYLEALISAAGTGAEVKVLLDSAFIDYDGGENSNSKVVDYINSIAEEEGLGSNLEARLIFIDDKVGRNSLEKVHNKGIIVDGKKVYIGSMNWGYGGPIRNREVGVIVENSEAASYYESVFNYDWNLTLNKQIETTMAYSSEIIFNQVNSTVNTEVAVINNNNTNPLRIELSTFDHQDKSNNDGLFITSEINRSMLVIDPNNLGKVMLSITLSGSFKNSILHSNGVTNHLPDNSFLIELTASSSNMSSSILWIDIKYQEKKQITNQDNSSFTEKPEEWNMRQLNNKLVLIFVIITMIMIAVLRDIVQYKLKNRFG